MKLNNKGYLLLEVMLAMTVIFSSILMIISSINFLLLDEKKCKEELEMSIMLYEMAASINLTDDKRRVVHAKSLEQGFTIAYWEREHLRIESDELFIEVKRN